MTTFAPGSLIREVGRSVPPDRSAVVYRGRQTSWAELLSRTENFARVLLDHQLGLRKEAVELVQDSPHHHVGLMLDNGPEYLETFLGASLARAAGFSVNTRFAPREVAQLLTQMDASAIVYSARFARVVVKAIEMMDVAPRLIVQVGDGPMPSVALRYESLLEQAATAALPETSSDDLTIICTGGTTGLPKGVLWRAPEFFMTSMRGHELIQSPSDGVALAIAAGLRSEPSRSICSTALVHFAAQALALQALVRGGTALLLPTDGPFSPQEFCAYIDEYKATDGLIIGDVLGKPVADELASGTHDASGMQWLLAGSALLSVATKRQLLGAVPHLEIRDSMGASETGMQAVALSTADRIETSFRLLPGNAVVDERGAPVTLDCDQPGMLARLEHRALGYFHDPESSALIFRTGELGDFVTTGDAVIRDGHDTFRLLGREASCINTGGEKVFAEEVEDALLADRAVRDCLVVGVPSSRWGHEVRAIVVLAAGESVEDVRQRLRVEIAGFKVPKKFIVTDAVPRLVSGKPDYARARQMSADL